MNHLQLLWLTIGGIRPFFRCARRYVNYIYYNQGNNNIIVKKLTEDFNNKYDADPISAPKCRIRLIDIIIKVGVLFLLIA